MDGETVKKVQVWYSDEIMFAQIIVSERANLDKAKSMDAFDAQVREALLAAYPETEVEISRTTDVAELVRGPLVNGVEAHEQEATVNSILEGVYNGFTWLVEKEEEPRITVGAYKGRPGDACDWLAIQWGPESVGGYRVKKVLGQFYGANAESEAKALGAKVAEELGVRLHTVAWQAGR